LAIDHPIYTKTDQSDGARGTRPHGFQADNAFTAHHEKSRIVDWTFTKAAA
jgi:hypothetical protein